MYVLSSRDTKPAAAPAAPPVVYFHGIQSHPGWFVGSACEIASRCPGVKVYMPTRRGSGANKTARGDAPSATQLLDDVKSALNSINAPAHAIGVSWGGKLITAYQASNPTQPLLSLTLIAPGIAPQVDVSFLAKLAIATALLTNPAKLFEIPLSDVSLFTDNEPMRQYLRDDPLRLEFASARFLYASRCLDKLISNSKPQPTFPTTKLILASNDRIINNPATKKTIQRLTQNKAIIQTLPGAHTLEFEHDPTNLYNAITPS